MNRYNFLLALTLPFLPATLLAADGDDVVLYGERVSPSAYGPSVVESMDAVREREELARAQVRAAPAAKVGHWSVPKLAAITTPHSGTKYLANTHGDTRMMLSFPEPVNFIGFWVADQTSSTVSTPGIRAIGYRAGEQVSESAWYCNVSSRPSWFEAGLTDVDGIEIQAIPALNGAGFYGVDDLAYEVVSSGRRVVLNFDELDNGTDLTGTNYGGVLWEPGLGDFSSDQVVPAPQTPPGADSSRGSSSTLDVGSGTRAVLPTLKGTIQSTIRGDAGQFSTPPDTCGAIGPNHLVSVVNTNFQVYDPNTGARMVNSSLGSFQPGTSGDPRVHFDHYSRRWIVVSTNFGTTMYLAVSTTENPAGSWFKTSFNAAQGTDAGKWIDFPTLGFDATRIYIGAYMVGGGNNHTLWVIDKAPLIAGSPSLGAITAFRGLTWEGSLQPCIHYGSPPAGYIVSRVSGSGIRIRRVEGTPQAPTLTASGSVVGVPGWNPPADAPALGASTNIDAGDDRLVSAVFRNNNIYTSHTIDSGGRAACRWYQLQANPASLIQSGTVTSPSLNYYYPSLMVNSAGHIAMGFSGSDASTRPSAYYTGRAVTDPAGEMAAPVLYRAGSGNFTILDQYGRNRWGDYSLTTLHPDNQIEMWTLQEYVHGNQTWGTLYARLSLGGDCNNNGVADLLDIQNGTSQDCNANNNPDECDLSGEISEDCNANSVPDECDISGGLELDCNDNLVPDACEVATGGAVDCNNNGVPDECDIAGGVAQDCNENGGIDACEIAQGYAPDCNGNGIPDSCDVSNGAPDCNSNGVPDTCDLAIVSSIDCNANGRPDECDLALGGFEDCNGNQVIDTCEVDTAQGLAGAYFNSTALSGPPRGKVDPTVNFNYGAGPAWPNEAVDNFSVRWAGFLKTLSSGNGSYAFFVNANDGVRLRVNGQLIIDQWFAQPLSERGGAIVLASNRIYAISLEYFATTGDAQVALSWRPPGGAKAIIPAANLIPGRDCNGNGRNDYCDFFGAFSNASPNYTPMGTGFSQTHVITTPPDAASDVTMQFWAYGDLSTFNESVSVSINGAPVGILFQNGGVDCAPVTQSLTVTAAAFNAAKAGGDASILMAPSASVNPTQCTDASYIRVTTSYSRVLSSDANGNLIPDECENEPVLCAGDVDCDGDVDFFDIDPFVLALSGETAYLAQYPGCHWLNADCDGDSDVDFFDIDPFVTRLGSTCP